jgi:endo-1,4-beta-xylanase
MRTLRLARVLAVLALPLVACSGSTEVIHDPPPELLSHECRDSDEKSAEPSELPAPESVVLRGRGRNLGTGIRRAQLMEPDYAATLAQQFDFGTPENEMKWDATEPTPGGFIFAASDPIVDFAQQHQQTIKGHVLIWHSQLPPFVNALKGADAVREAMTRHINGVMGHFRDAFPGVVTRWDVVNEAIDTPMGVAAFRDSVFYRELGEGYIAEAFQIAHAADPDARLFYNDFGIEGANVKAAATYEMIKKLVDDGVPIDGVGFQMHTTADDRGPSREEFRVNIQRYVDLGLKVNISEMDVNLCLNSNGEFALEQQRFRYNRIVRTCLLFDACESVAIWGIIDKYSWLNGFQTCMGAPYQALPLLFADDYAKKPAFWGVHDALNGCYYD